MKCRTVIHELALYLGKDPCERETMEEVRRHLNTCSNCRLRYRQLKTSMAALENGKPVESYETADSLWPELQSRLNEPKPKRDSVYSVRHWAPMATVAVAGLLLIVTINATFPKPTGTQGPAMYHPRDAGFSILPGSSARPKPVPPKTHKPDEPQEPLQKSPVVRFDE